MEEVILVVVLAGVRPGPAQSVQLCLGSPFHYHACVLGEQLVQTATSTLER
jgi:hypothetical protein